MSQLPDGLLLFIFKMIVLGAIVALLTAALVFVEF